MVGGSWISSRGDWVRVATSGNLWAEWANAHRSHPIDDPNQLPVRRVGWVGC